MTERSDDVLILDVSSREGLLLLGPRQIVGVSSTPYKRGRNSNPVLNQIIRVGSAYNRVIGFLEPRTFKVGMRYQF